MMISIVFPFVSLSFVCPHYSNLSAFVNPNHKEFRKFSKVVVSRCHVRSYVVPNRGRALSLSTPTSADCQSALRVALGDPRVNGGLENGQCNDALGGDDDDFHCVSLCVVVVCIPLLYSPRRDCQPLSATIQKSFPESTQHATQYRQPDVGFIQSAPLRTPNHRKTQVVQTN